jgi:diguanylate cyclase (GGDEF)-like protein
MVCKNYYAEIMEALRQEGFSDILVKEYPQVCLSPHVPMEKVNPIFEKDDPNVEKIILSENCVINSFLDTKSNSRKKETNYPHHCLEMFTNRELIEFFSSNGFFLVTPGWLNCWQTIIKEWGFDQESARLFFQESATKVILLETYNNPKNITNLTDFSTFIDLPYEVIPIGLDHFRLKVANMVVEWQIKNRDVQEKQSINQMQQQLANYALAFDMLSNLTRMMTEDDAVMEIRNIFQMLFAPLELTYVSLVGGKLHKIFPRETPEEHTRKLLDWALSNPDDYSVYPDNDGFILRISHLAETLGIIEIKQITFPQYSQQYLNMSLVLAPLCGLTISNARAYQIIEENETLLEHLASIDPLTGLFNRRRFYETGEAEFKRSKRYQRPLSSIMIDIDFFKKVNDTYSHAIGDQVLVELSRVLTSELRDSDIRARMGGEEFLVLLPETDLTLAKSLAERLRKRIAAMIIHTNGKKVQITISMGVAFLDDTVSTLDEFIHCSDLALFNAKRNGRNRVEIWNS